MAWARIARAERRVAAVAGLDAAADAVHDHARREHRGDQAEERGVGGGDEGQGGRHGVPFETTRRPGHLDDARRCADRQRAEKNSAPAFGQNRADAHRPAIDSSSPASTPATSCRERYRPLFVGHEHLLPTHRGWDPGALLLAREMAERFDAPLYFDETTRLLADLNRSVGNPELHSEATRHLSLRERRELLDAHYHPHRRRVDAAMAAAVATGDRVVHIASHSFTPELNGHVRTADIGMLYDPGGRARSRSRRRGSTRCGAPTRRCRLRRNYPYIGKSDGVTQVMRRRYPPERYVGIELEVNQRYVEAGGPAWPKIRRTLVETLGEALQLRGGTGPDGG